MGRARLVMRDDEMVARAIAEHAKVQAALRSAADAGLRDAVRRAPVDTGRLRSSLRLEKTESGWRYGTDVPYSAFVEFGTKDTRQRPFMRPSIDAAKRAARSQR